jgi:hypothetical protein
MALEPPFALPPGDIPTEPLPVLTRAPGLVHPELRPGIPTEPENPNYYRASLAGTAAAGPGSPGPAPDADGCCD